MCVLGSKCASGRTPLHMAAAEGLLDCAEILVEAGADVMATDNMGHTPLIMACVWSHREVGRWRRANWLRSLWVSEGTSWPSSFWDLLCRYLRNCMWHVEKRRELEERQLAENKCLQYLVKLRDGSQKGNWTRELYIFSKGNEVFYAGCVMCAVSLNSLKTGKWIWRKQWGSLPRNFLSIRGGTEEKNIFMKSLVAAVFTWCQTPDRRTVTAFSNQRWFSRYFSTAGNISERVFPPAESRIWEKLKEPPLPPIAVNL